MKDVLLQCSNHLSAHHKEKKPSVSHNIQQLLQQEEDVNEKEVTCTYLHCTKSHILSVFPLPHFFTASLCYLLSGRQHIGCAVPMRLQHNTATCLTWDNKSQPYGYLGSGQSAMLTPNLPQLGLYGHA